MMRRKCHFSNPSSFRCLSRLLSAAEPPRFLRYWLTHCFPSIAGNGKRGKERGHEAGVEQRLDGDDFGRGAGPGDGTGVRVGEQGIVHGVDQGPHVGGGHVIWIWFQP